MIGAIVKDDIVQNVIVINESQIAEMEAALSCEIVDARPYGLTTGDMRTASGWTRNAGGEQMILPLLEQEQYDSYSVMAQRAAEAEAQVCEVAEAATDDALAIITGEVDV